MRRAYGAALALVLVASAAVGAPPTLDIPPEVKATGDYVTVVPKTTAKAVTYVPQSGVEPFPSAMLKDPRAFVLPVRGLPVGRYKFVAVGSLGDEHATAPFTVVVGEPKDDKKDDIPPPKPVDPKPPAPPVTSFKVILVYESGDTLTAAQRAVLFGKEVETYLTTACTGGKAGWGRRDKDENPASDTSGVKDVWAAAKPKLTGVPCIAVAVNGTITLEPLPATPADAVSLLKSYAGGK